LSAAYEVARRQGIHGVTLRAVALEAKLSHGLVVFYFKQKDQLIGALLDRVLATTAMLRISEDVARLQRPPDRLAALLRQELERLSRDPRAIRLFFEYWALGVRHPAVRRKVGAALERYRAAFRAMAEDVLAAAPPASPLGSPGVAPGALAAVAVSLINGCAVQAAADPARFDTEAYLVAVHSILELLSAAPTGGSAAPGA
jgi:AcrR family transcriptional regulator